MSWSVFAIGKVKDVSEKLSTDFADINYCSAEETATKNFVAACVAQALEGSTDPTITVRVEASSRESTTILPNGNEVRSQSLKIELGPAVVVPPAPTQPDYGTLDRMPDTAEIELLVPVLVEIARKRHPGDEPDEYGAQIRVLSKTLGVFNEIERSGWQFSPEWGVSGVSDGINDAVIAIRGMHLDYRSIVRLLSHAIGEVSERFRLSRKA